MPVPDAFDRMPRLQCWLAPVRRIRRLGGRLDRQQAIRGRIVVSIHETLRYPHTLTDAAG